MFDLSVAYYEFWPWFINSIILFLDQYFGNFLDYLLPFNFRAYIWRTFLVLFVILPALFVIYIYITVLGLFIFRRRNKIVITVKNVLENTRGASILERFIEVTCQCWAFHAQFWHGYQVHGEQTIVDLNKRKKGCLIVYYHGALPIDCYYFITWFRTKYRILTRSVVDRFMFNVPGFETMLDVMGATTGPRSRIVDLLKKGNVVIVSPGGVREALFSKNYEIIWGERTGFAQCAIEAEVPIIPMFTSNVRQAFEFPERLKGETFRQLYEYTRLPLSVVFGGFPVKLDTYFGDPVQTIDRNVVEVVAETKKNIEILIKKHQYRPNKWWSALIHALRQRVYK